MGLQQLISASPKQGGAVDPQHRQGRGVAAAAVLHLQAEASPELWCGFVPGALQRAALWRESLVRWDAAPSALWHGHDWVLLSQTLSQEQCYWGKGSPSLGQPRGRALMPAFQQFLSWL